MMSGTSIMYHFYAQVLLPYRRRAFLLLSLFFIMLGCWWRTSTLLLLPFSDSHQLLQDCGGNAATCVPLGATTAATREGDTDSLDSSSSTTLLLYKESLKVNNGQGQEVGINSDDEADGDTESPEREQVAGFLDPTDEPELMETVDELRMALSMEIMESERRAHEGDATITGDPSALQNLYASKIMDEIRSMSLAPQGRNKENKDVDGGKTEPDGKQLSSESSCEGKYVYVYKLPSHFNEDLVKMCNSLVPWLDLCEYFENSGLGQPVEKTNDSVGTQVLVPEGQWFYTYEHALEIVYHTRVLQYRCVTSDPNLASLFYIPYYGGLDVIRWHWAPNATNEKRDALGWQLVEWLESQPPWKRSGGKDHVLVLGKISWEFRRQEKGNWGSRLLEFSQMQEVTKLLLERNPWHVNDVGVPPPTFFHPKSGADVQTWLSQVQTSGRTGFVSYAGKDSPTDTSNIRMVIARQCRKEPKLCKFLECEQDHCWQPAATMELFLNSHFCLQPPGDTSNRHAIFYSLMAGCIPVLFHPCTAYLQYPWHLPQNSTSYSVYIPENDMRKGTVNVLDVLKRISIHEREEMKQRIVDNIIPGLLYAKPGADLAPHKDAFDLTLENLLYRVSHLNELEQIAQN